jgi:integrase
VGTASLVVRPAVSLVAAAAGAGLPRYVLPEQARAIINAAETTAHHLLLETLWQSGGRITEVLRLRPCDLDEVFRAALPARPGDADKSLFPAFTSGRIKALSCDASRRRWPTDLTAPTRSPCVDKRLFAV